MTSWMPSQLPWLGCPHVPSGRLANYFSFGEIEELVTRLIFSMHDDTLDMGAGADEEETEEDTEADDLKDFEDETEEDETL